MTSKAFYSGNAKNLVQLKKIFKWLYYIMGEINNILLEEKQTEKLLKILINNKVTPIALDDVLTDLIRA